LKNSQPGGFSEEFGKAMLTLAEEDPDLLAVCPAMLEGTGLAGFSKKYPDRCFDTGIAEEHALTFASGLAAAGKHPVCAFYDTFLQRALDGVYHDAALANLPVVIAVDRAGAVMDGATHHGIYNCSFLRAIPNVTVMTISSPKEMYEALKFALSLKSPVVLRYAKGDSIQKGSGEPFIYGKSVICRHGGPGSPVIWAAGCELATALKAADLLNDSCGMKCTVIEARFLKPFDRETAMKLAQEKHFTIEDHSLTGGLFSALSETLSEVANGGIYGFGWSAEKVIGHGSPAQLKEDSGMTAEKIAEKIALIYQKTCSRQ
jgi:1-deoxy-D-xylulose-5-phosphate synthase